MQPWYLTCALLLTLLEAITGESTNTHNKNGIIPTLNGNNKQTDECIKAKSVIFIFIIIITLLFLTLIGLIHCH